MRSYERWGTFSKFLAVSFNAAVLCTVLDLAPGQCVHKVNLAHMSQPSFQ